MALVVSIVVVVASKASKDIYIINIDKCELW